MDDDYKRADGDKKRSSCCCIFSLQTGISLIVWFDFFFLIVLCCLCGLNYNDTAALNSEEAHWYDVPEPNPYYQAVAKLSYNFMTDGVTIILQLIKLYFGLAYMKNVTFPEKPGYEYLE